MQNKIVLCILSSVVAFHLHDRRKKRATCKRKGPSLPFTFFLSFSIFFTTNQLTIQTVFFFSLSSPFLILVLLMPSFSSDDHQKTATKYFIHIRLAIRIQHDVSLYYIILCSYLTYKISYKSHHFFLVTD